MVTKYLFIDGTNLYASQYGLFGPYKYLHFRKFILEIEHRLKVKFDKIYFYASYTPRSKKNKKYLINEFKFYKAVKSTKNLVFFKGYRSKTSGKEKEVDVKLSVDLVGYGLLDYYDQAYLMTGDADFLQACNFITKHKSAKKINLICIVNKIMFKGLYYYPSNIIQFRNHVIKNISVAKKAKIIYIDEKNLIQTV